MEKLDEIYVPLYPYVDNVREKQPKPKTELDKRIEELIKRYDPERLRRGMRLFVRVTKLSEEGLTEYIQKQRDLPEEERDKYCGLAQSVLYSKKKLEGKHRNDLDLLNFDLPWGGSFLEFDEPREAKEAKFFGDYAGIGTEFSGPYSGEKAIFKGEYSGAYMEVSGANAGREMEFYGWGAGYRAKFSGANSGREAKFWGKESGYKIVVSGATAGEEISFCPCSGVGAVFSGFRSGKRAVLRGEDHRETGRGMKLTGAHAGTEMRILGTAGRRMEISGCRAGEGILFVRLRHGEINICGYRAGERIRCTKKPLLEIELEEEQNKIKIKAD